MTREVSALRSFRILAWEALADAVRRRIAPVVAGIALLSLLFVHTCTSCSPAITVNGEVRELSDVAGFTGAVLFVVLGLWTMALAGVLASDHLAATLGDGSANLSLARPVGRPTFALARLAGVVAMAWAMGVLLLGATTWLLQLRQGLSIEAGAWGLVACLSGAFCIAALAMAASLVLPRTATALLVFLGIGLLAAVNVYGLSGGATGGVTWVLDQVAPPIGTSMLRALAPWLAPIEVTADPLVLTLRLLFWDGASAALLVLTFSRTELGR